MRWSATLAATLLMLAGCASDDAPADTADHSEHEMPDHVMHDLAFATAATNASQVFTGTFQLIDDPSLAPLHTQAGQGSAVQFHDISDLMPPGAPVMMTASVTPDDGRVQVFVTATDPGDVWSTSCTGCAAQTLEAAITRSDTVQIGAFFTGTAAADLSDNADGLDYEVAVDVAGFADVMLSGMVLAVDLSEPGTHVLFEGVEGDVPDTLVFGPDDAFMGTLDGGTSAQTRLQENATTGEYVFLPKGHGQFMKLRVGTGGETPSVRVLDQVVDLRGPFTPEGGATTSVIEASNGQPLQVILCVGGGAAAMDAAASVTGPSGDILALDFIGPNVGGFGNCAATEMGDASLLPGDYELTYSDTGSNGVQVQLIFIHYGR